jgi:hypothetical protein
MDLYLVDVLTVEQLINPWVLQKARFRPISLDNIPKDISAIITHTDICAELNRLLGSDINLSPENYIRIGEGDIIYFVQYHGPCYSCKNSEDLPEGASIDFVEINFQGSCGNCPVYNPEQNCRVCIPWVHDTLG